jgi:transcriptional regulator with XRE-family HTH domain
MNGQELRSIRRSLGLTVRELGYAIGYRGNQNTVSVQIRQYEGGHKTMPPWIERLVTMFGKHGVPPEWTLEPDRSANQQDGQDRFETLNGR